MERNRICAEWDLYIVMKNRCIYGHREFLSLTLSLSRQDLKQRKVKGGELVEANGGELMDQNYPRLKVLTNADEIAFLPLSPHPPPLLNRRRRQRNPSVTQALSSPCNLHPFLSTVVLVLDGVIN